jgi:hypothetical protein
MTGAAAGIGAGNRRSVILSDERSEKSKDLRLLFNPSHCDFKAAVADGLALENRK